MRFTAKRAVAVAAATVAITGLTAAPAAAHGTTGTKSLAAVLTADKSGFDHNPHDFDILTAAVQAVLKAKPKSPVGILADGTKPVTAFIPSDSAFKVLVADITKSKKLPSEKAAFTAVAGLGIDTVEAVLLYHVVPGATVDRKAAFKSDGKKLATATGAKVTVDVYGHPGSRRIQLIDADRNDRNPRIVKFDINKGNKQIAHAIDRVLRPIDLP